MSKAPLLLFAACASKPDTVFIPTTVNVPVPVKCQIPTIAPLVDLMAQLPQNASLTEGMKSALVQTEYDRGFILQIEAALDSCR